MIEYIPHAKILRTGPYVLSPRSTYTTNKIYNKVRI